MTKGEREGEEMKKVNKEMRKRIEGEGEEGRRTKRRRKEKRNNI